MILAAAVDYPTFRDAAEACEREKKNAGRRGPLDHFARNSSRGRVEPVHRLGQGPTARPPAKPGRAERLCDVWILNNRGIGIF